MFGDKHVASTTFHSGNWCKGKADDALLTTAGSGPSHAPPLQLLSAENYPVTDLSTISLSALGCLSDKQGIDSVAARNCIHQLTLELSAITVSSLN